jgi:hypothetical protein
VDQRYISKGWAMIDDELKQLILELKRDLGLLKADSILIKYSIEQVEEKLDKLSADIKELIQ